MVVHNYTFLVADNQSTHILHDGCMQGMMTHIFRLIEKRTSAELVLLESSYSLVGMTAYTYIPDHIG